MDPDLFYAAVIDSKLLDRILLHLPTELRQKVLDEGRYALFETPLCWDTLKETARDMLGHSITDKSLPVPNVDEVLRDFLDKNSDTVVSYFDGAHTKVESLLGAFINDYLEGQE
jgi:hypothetical protein